MNHKLMRWLPAVLWATVIFLLSSMSAPPAGPLEFPLKDKIGHAILFAGLAALVARAFLGHNLSLPKSLVLAILVTSGYGASDEFHQRFVPYRSCDALDWLADTIGAGIAATAFYLYESHRSAKTNRPTA